ncbi:MULTISPECIES: triacylglycerol lipase [unclassified Fibrobacter]|uniref:esterase/lipase family protein n=1 Tax=unclassified Fibrobacter TaxID=2634177 RepID=UPI000D7A7493|nr:MULTISPECIES: hypothetical protein [unclassified Fibrobacter]PWJ68977.1 hypothetical protein BGX12_10632 [Fibrobacter sp. UWR4]PZW70823.1 hypothetical protein C8E88_101015 [Fibrobacter sp. UWR1]
MRNKLLAVALLSVIAFARDDYAEAFKNFKSYPSSTTVEVGEWVEPYDQTFLPYATCGEVKDFEVVSVADLVKDYYDDKDKLIDYFTNGHYFCVASVVRITYHVTCQNKLKYKGIYYLFSDPYKEKDPVIGDKEAVDKKFKAWAHDWKERNLACLKEDGTFDESCSEYNGRTYSGYDGKFDEKKLKEQWVKQKVAYPAWKNLGVPGKKLAKPVLFVHGLGDDYRSWGVASSVDADELCEKDAICSGMRPSICVEKLVPSFIKETVCTEKLKKKLNNYKEALLRTNDEFQKGLVKKYSSGSAPDIIVRNQNIYITDDNINSDGIYFFQAPGKINDDKRWEEAPLDWNGVNDQTTQSGRLYKKLEEILDDFSSSTSINWRETPEVSVDIVAHSQGGLVVREMLRGLRAENVSKGSDNPANHIGRVITVDTPHFGAATAAENSKSESIAGYFGLGKIVDDLNNPKKHGLANVKVNLDYTNWLTDLGLMAVDALLGWSTATLVATSDYEVNMKGPYLGPYTVSLNVDPLGPGSFDVDIMDLDPLEDSREQAENTRRIGKHLERESDFLQNLNYGTNGRSYPKKPNDENLEIVPLYSGSTKTVVSAALESIADNLKISCPELDDEDSKVACVSLESYLESKSNDFKDSLYGTINIDDVNLNQNLLSILNSLMDDWLANSDLIVESESQRYESDEFGITSSTIPELKEPRKFELHDALAPWETVAHLDLKMGNMAASARQGLDIACALHVYCDELLVQKAGVKLVYLEDGTVGLTGDFDLSPLYLVTGKQGSRASDGINYLEAIYEPGVGSYVNYTDADGVLRQDVVLPSSIATNPRLLRNGSIITASFDNQSGKTFSKDYAMPNMSSQTTFSIIAEEGTLLPKVVVGTATASDLSSQIAPVSPTAWKKNRDVFVMHREARGDNESNTSRPRILIANSTDKDVAGFKVAYYFTADPARNPVVEVDYPKTTAVLENLGGDQWRFMLDVTDSVLKAKSVFPSLDGWQIRLYYNDWTDFDHFDDWSANYNIGIPQNNKKIVVYDVEERILWGQEPPIYKSVDDGVIASPKGVLSWSDAASWEDNAFKPQVSVKNTGSVALKNYHAKLWFRVPNGKSLYVPVDDWYTPVSKPSLHSIGENVWELDMYFDRYILYPNESVVEGNIGLHLTDWSTFDKLVCGIALFDSEDDVIFGKVPSVDECKTYSLPSLLNAQYVWSL